MAQALRAGLRNGGIRRGGLRPGLGNGSLFAVAPLDLFFARNRTLDPRVTFTRASSGTYVGSDGLLKTATNSGPRFDHNPTTGESLGLLVEEQRTNSIRNNTMIGAVAGTPGTLPTNWVIGGGGQGTLSRTIAVGESGGIPWVDFRFFGTTSTTGFILAFEPTTQIAVLTGQAWTSSFYVALAGGSLTNIAQLRHDIVERTSAGGSVLQNFSGDFKSTLTSSLARSTYAVTLSGGATTAFVQPSIEFGFASGVAIDITLRIGLPQLEQGAFATSVIPTTGTAATRNADVASITGTNFSLWYRQDEGTVFAERVQQPLDAAVGRRFLNINDGSLSNTIQLYQSGGGLSVAVSSVAGVNDFNPNPSGVPATGAIVKAALGFNGAGKAMARDGGAISQVSTAPPTSGMTTMVIGAQNSTNVSCTSIRRLTYWPARLANSTLQAITQ